MQLSTKEKSLRNIGSEYRGSNIVFIVGCPRSGTTWVQKLLMCHAKIRSGQESDVFDMFIGPQLRAWRQLSNPGQSGRPVGLPSYFDDDEFISILRRYVIELLKPMIGKLRRGEIFVEKTPSHALYLDEIVELLPQCRIVHVLRDVRDVVVSLLAAAKSWGNQWAPQNALSAARLWVKHVQAVRKSAGKIPKKQIYELCYEDLIYDSVGALRGLSAFLQLEWDEAVMKRAVESNEFEVAKVTGGTPIPLGGKLKAMLGPITIEPSGFLRRGKCGVWREELSEEELFSIWKVARHTMKEVGYTWDSAHVS